jgi:hypothetical protein
VEIATSADYLAVYLNDHLAGSLAGLELARRARDSNQGSELGRTLDELATEIEAERATLREVMESLGIAVSRFKPAGAWLGEKLGRLKLNGQLRGYSDLSRVVELEGLCLGVRGKRLLWQALEQSAGPALPEFDFAALGAQAEAQAADLDTARLKAAMLAFSGS